MAQTEDLKMLTWWQNWSVKTGPNGITAWDELDQPAGPKRYTLAEAAKDGQTARKKDPNKGYRPVYIQLHQY